MVPYSEKDLPHVDWEATDQYYEYYHGYTRLEKQGIRPLVPYGFGLSYTTFEITDPKVLLEGENLKVTAKIKNTGEMSLRSVHWWISRVMPGCVLPGKSSDLLLFP